MSVTFVPIKKSFVLFTTDRKIFTRVDMEYLGF